MKKIYNRPESTIVRFDTEMSMMLSTSVSGSGSQSDDWSNEREWDSTNDVPWSDVDTDE